MGAALSPPQLRIRPQRSAHQAVREVQTNIRAGYGWVVDTDLQAFFDRVNHDRLMARLKSRCMDAGLLRLINRYLKAGVSVAGTIEATTMGVPQGGPSRRCWQTWYWMNWIGNWTGAATAFPAMPMAATFWSKANEQESA
jgi:hypothetical protein